MEILKEIVKEMRRASKWAGTSLEEDHFERLQAGHTDKIPQQRHSSPGGEE